MACKLWFAYHLMWLIALQMSTKYLRWQMWIQRFTTQYGFHLFLDKMKKNKQEYWLSRSCWISAISIPRFTHSNSQFESSTNRQQPNLMKCLWIPESMSGCSRFAEISARADSGFFGCCTDSRQIQHPKASICFIVATLVSGFCTTVLCTRYSLSEIAPTNSVSKLPANCKRLKVALFHKLKKRMELSGNWGLQEWEQKTGRGTDDMWAG